MFPRTGKGDNMRLDVHRLMSTHVETVVRLDKKKPKEYVEIGVDAEDYYKIKDSEEAR